MSISLRRWALVLAAGIAMASSAVRADDLSGVWAVDQNAWAVQSKKVAAAMLKSLSPSELAAMQQAGVDPAAAMQEAMQESFEVTMEFLPDGRLRTTTADDGPSETGTWTRDGDTLHLAVAADGETQHLDGSLIGDRIIVKPVVADGDGDAPHADMMKEFVITFARQP